MTAGRDMFCDEAIVARVLECVSYAFGGIFRECYIKVGLCGLSE